MLKKIQSLKVTAALFIFLSSLAFANESALCAAGKSCAKKHFHIKRVAYKGDYKGEEPQPYKSVVVSQTVHDPIPCMTYTINPGPYIGISPGLRTNYSPKAEAYKGFEGTLFGGFSVMSWNFYLAAEFFGQTGASLQNYISNVNDNGDPIGLRSTWGYGVSILPGYVIADGVLAYLRGGVIQTHFQDVAKTATGAQGGIGLQAATTEHWNVRAEYSYSFYQSLTNLGNPRSDQFEIGVLYKFNL